MLNSTNNEVCLNKNIVKFELYEESEKSKIYLSKMGNFNRDERIIKLKSLLHIHELNEEEKELLIDICVEYNE